MNPFAELSQIPTVSDSPEETPEDLLRQQMMQRLGVALNPQAVAQKAAAERLGQTGKGVGGWLQRILGGAAEGMRFAQDPKYRGAFAEELGRAQEQEKNLMPYARQLEASSAMREKARLEAREKERATAAKVYDSLLKDAQVKFKNETDRFKANAFILESKVKSDKLRAEGKFTEAKTLDQQVETEYFRKFGPGKPTEAMQAAFVKSGGWGDVTPEAIGEEQNALFNRNLLLKLAPGIMRPQGSGVGRVSTSERLIPQVGLFGQQLEPRREQVQNVSTPSVNMQLSPEQQQLREGLTQRAISALGGGQPQASAPAPSPAFSPSPKPKTKSLAPPPVGTAAAPATTRPKGGLGPPAPPPDKAVAPKSPADTVEVQKNLNRFNMTFPNAGAAKEAREIYNAANYAAELRSLLGESMEEMAPFMGAIKGGRVARKVRSVFDALGVLPADSNPRKVRIENLLKRNETIDRVITTGKQMNLREMDDIITYMPSQEQTYSRALTNALVLDLGMRMFTERMTRNDIATPAQPGALSRYAETIYEAYYEANKAKGEERARKLQQIERMFRPERIWSAVTEDAEGGQQ